ncbi:ABC-three component system middle component 2 [Metamycoplasma hominis]
MRILILLDCANNWLSDDKIIYLDFFPLYSKTYEIRDENLNGDCSFMINDLTVQRNLKKDLCNLTGISTSTLNKLSKGLWEPMSYTRFAKLLIVTLAILWNISQNKKEGADLVVDSARYTFLL